MKIAYISLHWPREKTSSIGKKIESQMAFWRKQGHTAAFFSHMHSVDSKPELISGQQFIYKKAFGIGGTLRTEIDRSVKARQLIKALEIFQPDLIYMRWAMYVFPIQQLTKIAPFILEINTLDLIEHERLGAVLSRYNQITREILLDKTAGMVFPSGELAQHDSFAAFRKPFRIIPNGIDVEKYPFYSAPRNQIPRLVFIGTSGMPWQGADKLIAFAGKYPDIGIDLVGFGGTNNDIELPSNVKVHPYLTGEKLESILANADSAIGTMALHRKGMQEASPLKVRDYLARGIPTILPYKDTALENLQIPEILRIPNTPENLEQYGDVIHDFVIRMRGKRVSIEAIRERIDTEAIEQKRLSFFKKFVWE